MSAFAELPQDVVRKSVIVTLVGKNQLRIENFKTILEYDEDKAKIRTRDGIVYVTGSNLKVNYFNCEEIKITGIIQEIKFGV
jgi:sporulation protein YqfC